ncbi:MAG: endopeptidase La, partial [Cytophagales bacterium]|nr:endopeptidase La [Cytophagales bacterium]
NKELDKLLRMNPSAAEYPMAMNYVEYLVDLPWNEYTKDNFDLHRAKKILDEDHFGLEKVKERIIEYLAVLKLKNNMKAPIICLYGPPGVGKTSLGRSIAKALNRKYIRMSLGGLHDEAEIRGHRRTYIGAMPGKVIHNIKKANSSNPVFILDEIDKLGSDYRSDPSSAMLEVLDPEQNQTFHDNYLDMDYDLSKVLFIATANSLETIPAPLRDRMEIIEVSGYTLEEKLQIAKKYLVPKQKKENGLAYGDLAIEDEAIVKIIDSYTRESGVRNLERQIGGVVRKAAKFKAADEKYDKKVKASDVKNFLGMEIFDKEEYKNNEIAGIVTGLAWTQVGGEILSIESSLSRGKGKITISGQLGDVMKESASAALSYLKANADTIGIDYRVFDNYDLHIHVPAGAVPKDGPSAGITMLTSLASVFTQRKVKEKLAMTGEITLSGRVLPVGGIKEKILAAKRAGITTIMMCAKNRKDIEEIDKIYISDLTFHYVESADQVLEFALLPEKVAKSLKFELPEEKTDKKEAILHM